MELGRERAARLHVKLDEALELASANPECEPRPSCPSAPTVGPLLNGITDVGQILIRKSWVGW